MIPASTPHCWPTSRRCAALFNSYYVSAGPRHPRLRRGDLSRPTLAEVMDYRRQVNRSTAALLQAAPGREDGELHARVTLGIAHEQQHQELIVTDMKHHIACQPLSPLHSPAAELAAGTAAPMRFLELPGGLAEIGHRGEGFAFDNKLPRHRIWFEPFALADRLVTETEYLAFMADGGHATPLLWLSDGWTTVSVQPSHLFDRPARREHGVHVDLVDSYARHERKSEEAGARRRVQGEGGGAVQSRGGVGGGRCAGQRCGRKRGSQMAQWARAQALRRVEPRSGWQGRPGGGAERGDTAVRTC